MWKWWSGKTTLTTAFTYFIQNKYKNIPIWLFDADLNSHILAEFGYKNEKQNLLWWDFTKVSNFIEPSILENKIDTEIAGFWTIPLNEKTIFLSPQEESDFSKYYGVKKDNITFFTIWNYSTKDDPTGKCYHSELNSFELAIHRIKDSKNDYVIVDSTAGADNLGTSLYMAYDTTFFIVEPTKRSISVYKDYISLKEVDTENIFVIANKVEDENDKKFLQSEIASEKIIAYFSQDTNLYEKTSKENYKKFIENNKISFETIDKVAKKSEKNKKEYSEKLYSLFEKEANWWYSNVAGIDLLKLYPKK